MNFSEIKPCKRRKNDSIYVKIGDYKKAKVPGQDVDDEFPYINFIQENNNDEDTIEFQERMKNNTVFEV